MPGNGPVVVAYRSNFVVQAKENWTGNRHISTSALNRPISPIATGGGQAVGRVDWVSTDGPVSTSIPWEIGAYPDFSHGKRDGKRLYAIACHRSVDASGAKLSLPACVESQSLPPRGAGRLPMRSDVWQTAGMDTKETNCSNSQADRVRMLANLLLGALVGLAACWTIW